MGYMDAMSALKLQMPRHIPRTEYSASGHWKLVSAVTGIAVDERSDGETMRQASLAFERAWDFGLTWSVLIHAGELDACRTRMGHAQYAQGGVDFDTRIECPFNDVDEVLSFDPYEAYGELSQEKLVASFNRHYWQQRREKPDQVVMTGIYITMISGLLEIFGWNMLLSALGEDSEAFGGTANRYADWISQYFRALAQSDADVVMIHDDIVWTSGPFANPAWYRKYIFPNYEKLFEPLHQAGKLILYTSDGTYDAFVDDVAACGVNGFVMEPTTDLAAMAKKCGKTHSLIGNADCRALTFGTREDIRSEVRRCMDIGRDCPGFVMAVGNHIPPNVPVENALYYNDCYLSMADRW